MQSTEHTALKCCLPSRVSHGPYVLSLATQAIPDLEPNATNPPKKPSKGKASSTQAESGQQRQKSGKLFIAILRGPSHRRRSRHLHAVRSHEHRDAASPSFIRRFRGGKAEGGEGALGKGRPKGPCPSQSSGPASRGAPARRRRRFSTGPGQRPLRPRPAAPAPPPPL